jgi:cyanophycin synthetase
MRNGEPGVYNLMIEYKEEQPALAAYEMALSLVRAAMHDQPFDMAGEIDRP